MSATDTLAKTLLKLFAEARDHKLSATSLRTKLATAGKKAEAPHDAEAVDRAIAALIEDGKVAVTGGGKAGPHPRPKGSYRLTASGKDHVRPQKPDVSDEQLEVQKSFLLLKFVGAKEHSLTSADLKGKLKTKFALGAMEFLPEALSETLAYHLHELVKGGNLDERRQGVSTRYTLTDDGWQAIATTNQHDSASIILSGTAFNSLIRAMQQGHVTKADHAGHEADDRVREARAQGAHQPEAPRRDEAAVGPEQIHEYVRQLKADRYAGRDLIPIYEVRRLVGRHHGDHAASHPVFDRLLKAMRAEGKLEIIAIADSRETPQDQLDDAIPGMNETLFFIDAE